ncbi:reverse transcriptase domain-containing protein [Tanacetum coccineum]
MNTTSRESVSKTDERIDKLADQLSTLVEIVSKKVVTPAPVKAVEEICVTCSGPHAWYNCPNTDNNQSSVCAATGSYNQVNPPNRVSNQMAPPGFAPVQNNGQNRFNQNQGQGNNFNRGNNFHGNQGFQAQNNHAPNFQNQGFQNQPFQVPNNQVQQEFSNEFSSYKRTNDQMMRNMQNQINSLKGEVKNEIQNTMKTQQAVLMNQQNVFQTNLQNMLSGFFQNQASTSGTLPSNTIPNPKGEMKAITTRSGVAYEGPSIPTNPSPKKTLPKPNIPYPSRRNDQKSYDKASNQMEKIFQIFQDLRFDINTIERELLGDAPQKLPEKLGDPGKFLIPCNFPGMDVCHALADLGASINLMPLSIWKRLSLPELTPTRMTLELADRSITHPKGLAEDVFVKVGKFHFPTDFVVVDFEADPRVPLILGRSFLRTSRALIDVFEGELILRDGNEQIIFHVDGISKHPQKHVNESIKMVNDTCEDSFEGTNNLSSGGTTPLSDFHLSLEFFKTSKSLLERFTDEPALVCLPPPEDDNDEKEKQEVKNIAEPTAKRQTRITPCLKNFKVIQKESIFHSNKTPQISSVFAITSALPTIKPKDSLIMGDEHLSTFRVEEISQSQENPRIPSIKDEDVQEEKFQVYSNPLFEIDDNHNSSNINLLFNEMLEDDECFDPGGDNDEIDSFLAIEVSTNIEEGYYDSERDVFYLESLLSDDTTHNLSPKNDLLHHEFAGEIITNPSRIAKEHEEYISRMWLLCRNLSSRSLENFHASPNTIIESLPTFHISVQDSDSHREEIDIFPGPNDSIPPGIESDFDSEEEIIFLDNLLNDDISVPKYERFTIDIEPNVPMINNFDDLNEDECFDPRGGEINVEVDDSFTFFRLFSRFSPTLWFLLYFSPPGMKTPFLTPAHLHLEPGGHLSVELHVL